MTFRSLALALTLLAGLACASPAQDAPRPADPDAERIEARLGELRTLLKQVEAKREESRVAGRPIERLTAEVEAVRAQLEQAERARVQLGLGRKQAELRRQLEELRAAKRMDEAERVATALAELDGQLELLGRRPAPPRPPAEEESAGPRARLRDLEAARAKLGVELEQARASGRRRYAEDVARRAAELEAQLDETRARIDADARHAARTGQALEQARARLEEARGSKEPEKIAAAEKALAALEARIARASRELAERAQREARATQERESGREREQRGQREREQDQAHAAAGELARRGESDRRDQEREARRELERVERDIQRRVEEQARRIQEQARGQIEALQEEARASLRRAREQLERRGGEGGGREPAGGGDWRAAFERLARAHREQGERLQRVEAELRTIRELLESLAAPDDDEPDMGGDEDEDERDSDMQRRRDGEGDGPGEDEDR